MKEVNPLGGSAQRRLSPSCQPLGALGFAPCWKQHDTGLFLAG